MSAGPANEATQTVSFIVTNNNSQLFSVQPAVASNGDLTFTLAANESGDATVTVLATDDGGTANGGVDTSAPQTFTITVAGVNDAPTATSIPTDITVVEDATSSVDLSALTLTDKDSGSSDIRLTVVVGEGTLTASSVGSVSVTGSGTASLTLEGTASNIDAFLNTASHITYTPLANTNGNNVTTLTLTANDLGATGAGGGLDVVLGTVNVDITAVNDVPAFTKGADQTVDEDSGPHTVTGWATGISKGPQDENAQELTFAVTNISNPLLFAVAPAIDKDGILTYTLNANASGQSTMDVGLSDDGGTANGGVDTSADQTFMITVNAVNDAPTVVSVPSDVTVIEDVDGPVDLSALTLTDMDAGTNNIAIQVAVNAGVLASASAGSVVVTGSGTASLTLTGTATNIDAFLNTATHIMYTPVSNESGDNKATITLTGNDGGGDVVLGTVNVDITAVNDVPAFTKGADQTVDEDSGPHTVTGWATGISKGPQDENAQALTFAVTNISNPLLFATAPAIDAATGNLTYTLNANASGQSTMDVGLSDDGGTANGGVDMSESQSFMITVNAVNDAPTVVSVPSDVTVIEDADGPVDLSALTLTDLDAGANDIALQVAVNAGVLASASAGSVVVTGSGTASLTLTGTATNIDAFLNTATHIMYTPVSNESGDNKATITLTGNDGGGDVVLGTVNVDITAVNDAPAFTKGADQTVDEDSGPHTVTGWATGISKGPQDENAQELTFAVTNISNPLLFATAPAIDAATGNLTYMLNANASGQSTMDVGLSDDGGTANGGADTSESQSFMITVNAVNDAPVLTMPATATVAEDGSTMVTGISVSDPDAQPMSVLLTATSIATLASTTGISITAGSDGSSSMTFSGTLADVNAALASVTYAPSENQTSGASLTILVSDGTLSDTKTTTFTVTPVNDAPVATSDVSQVFQGNSVIINVLSNDTDVDGDALSVASTSTPSSGTATINANNSITYVAAAAFEGPVTFTYTVSDSNGGTHTATVTVTVNGAGPDGDGASNAIENLATPPVPGGLTGDGNGDGILDSAQESVASLPIASGSNEGKYVTVQTGTGAPLGQVTSSPIPDPQNAPTGVSFPIGQIAFNVTGLMPGQSSQVILYLPRGVTIQEYWKFGPASPGANPTWYPFPFNGTTGAFILAETVDSPPRVVLFFKDGQLGDDDWTENGVIVDPGVPIFSSNALPVAASDALDLNEDASLTFNVLANDVDTDGDDLTIVSITQPTNGTAVLGMNGEVTYTPAAHYHGADAFTYFVSDGKGSVVEGSVTMTVTSVEDAPVALDDTATTAQDTPVTLSFLANDSDADGDVLTLSERGDAQHGTVRDNADGTLTYTPNAGFFGVDSFTYGITDGKNASTATVTVAVTNTPDVPVGVQDVGTGHEDSPIMIAPLANDVDPDNGTLSIASFTQPEHGSVTEKDGVFTYTPEANYYGADTFTYVMNNATYESAATTVTLMVTSVNDVPEFTASTVITAPAEGEVIAIGSAEIANPDDTERVILVAFEAASDVEDTQLTYTWELAADAMFRFGLLSHTSTETSHSFTVAEIAAVMQTYNWQLTESNAVYQRITATDSEGAEVHSSTQSFTLTRGFITSNEEEGLPTEFALEGNYPNPFNPSTTIAFSLTEPAHTRLTIYDMQGREVLTALSQTLPAGKHTQRLEMGDLPSGTYLYRLTSGTNTASKVLQLIK